MPDSFAWNAAVFFTIFSNLVWYLAKFFAHRQGYEVSWFSGHFEIFGQLSEIGNEHDSGSVRKKAKWLAVALKVLVAATLVTAGIALWEHSRI